VARDQVAMSDTLPLTLPGLGRRVRRPPGTDQEPLHTNLLTSSTRHSRGALTGTADSPAAAQHGVTNQASPHHAAVPLTGAVALDADSGITYRGTLPDSTGAAHNVDLVIVNMETCPA
jgi:hypothetical protein